jgi:hypothetical protein
MYILVWSSIYRTKQSDNGRQLFTEVGIHLKTTLKPRRGSEILKSWIVAAQSGKVVVVPRRISRTIMDGKSHSFHLIRLGTLSSMQRRVSIPEIHTTITILLYPHLGLRWSQNGHSADVLNEFSDENHTFSLANVVSQNPWNFPSSHLYPAVPFVKLTHDTAG